MIRTPAVPEPSPDTSPSRSTTATSRGPSTTTRAVEAGSPAAGAGPLAGSPMAGLAGPLCLVLLAGLAMPPHQGLLLPLGLVLAMVVVGERRLRLVAGARAALAEGRGHPLARLALLVAALVSVAVLLTVLARAVGALLVEVPASLWGAGAAGLVALLWALVGGRLPARARPVVLILLSAGIPLAGVLGTRYEANGPHAHGWAHGGPILGIHPFQTTAILIDGEGPFDLPINDYVEPEGGRGYDPAGLADALDRALASIALRVYPQGPARMQRALVDAEVEAVVTPAVWERLDRAPFEETQPRLRVRSGSFGRDSRVEFVCPGRRLDPRGPQGETVMNRMCPDKYASEASAGLGVTGRWSGYSEGRGQDRGGLHALLGWTRSDDVLERETRWWAWLVLALVGGVLVGGALVGGALLRPVARVGEGLRGVGGALGVLALAALVLAAIVGMGEPGVGALPAGPSWMGWPSLAAWAPALALGSLGLFALDGPAERRSTEPRTGTSAPAQGRGIAAPALLVVIATLALAACLPALAWIFPVRGAEGAQLPAFVRGLAEAIGEPAGLTIFEVEGAVGSALVGLLLGGAVATAAGAAGAARLLVGRPSPGRTIMVVLGVLAVAALLVVSRKTAGAAALVPGVVGMTLVLGSGLVRLAPRGLGTLPMGRSGSLWGSVAHLAWTAVGAALVWAAVDPLPTQAFVTLCTVVGLATVLAAGLAGLLGGGVAGRGRPDSDPTLERRGVGRL
jgi:hypothetical protein